MLNLVEKLEHNVVRLERVIICRTKLCTSKKTEDFMVSTVFSQNQIVFFNCIFGSVNFMSKR